MSDDPELLHDLYELASDHDTDVLPRWVKRAVLMLFSRANITVMAPPLASDGGSRLSQTLRDIVACASAWEDDARLLGNVRAGDVKDACIAALQLFASGPTQDRTPRDETAERIVKWLRGECAVDAELPKAWREPEAMRIVALVADRIEAGEYNREHTSSAEPGGEGGP